MGSVKSCPHTLRSLDAGDGCGNGRLIAKRMKFQNEAVTAADAAATTKCETGESWADLNGSLQVAMSEPNVDGPIVDGPIVAVPIVAVPIVAGPTVAVPTVAVTIDAFAHGTQGCRVWNKNRGKELRTNIGLGQAVNLQTLFNSARKPAIRVAKAAGRSEIKLTCSKCALAVLSPTLVMPYWQDEEKRKDALRDALAGFLIGREEQG